MPKISLNIFVLFSATVAPPLRVGPRRQFSSKRDGHRQTLQIGLTPMALMRSLRARCKVGGSAVLAAEFVVGHPYYIKYLSQYISLIF